MEQNNQESCCTQNQSTEQQSCCDTNTVNNKENRTNKLVGVFVLVFALIAAVSSVYNTMNPPKETLESCSSINKASTCTLSEKESCVNSQKTSCTPLQTKSCQSTQE